MSTFGDIESALEAAQDEDALTQNDSNDGDYERYPRIKLASTSAIRGTIVDVGFTGDPFDKNNIRGADDYRKEGDFVVTLEDPEIQSGALFEAAGRDNTAENLAADMDASDLPVDGVRTPSRDFRLVDPGLTDCSHIEESVEKIDGDYEPVGVEIYGSQFVGQQVDSFSEAMNEYDRIDVFLSGQGGRMVTQAIDATLAQSAFIREDGSKATGFCEFPRDYGTPEYDPTDDGYPRVARNPVIHPEVEGQEVALLSHFGDLSNAMDGDGSDDKEDGGQYRKVFADILVDTDDGWTVATQQDTLEPVQSLVSEDDMWLEYHEPDGGFGAGDGGDTSPSTDALAEASATNDDSFDFDDMEDAAQESRTTMDDLDQTTRGFAEEAKAYVGEMGGVDEAFDDWAGVVKTAQDDGDVSQDISPTEIREAIDNSL